MPVWAGPVVTAPPAGQAAPQPQLEIVPPPVPAPPAIQAANTDLSAMLVNRTLARLGLELELEPEGKTIEKIWVDPYNVFLADEKLASWANAAHFHTKERTVHEELLFLVGEPWREKIGLETGRNLRKNLPITVAQVVTCKGTQPGTIQVVVVTRDIWSLRASYDLQLTDGRLEYFFIGLFEYNWLGHAETISPFYFEMNQATMMFAQRYVNPRVAWSRIALREDAGVIYNYKTGSFEGGIATLKLFHPLYSLSEKWGWEMNFDIQSRIQRTFSQGQVARVAIAETGESLPLQYSSAFLKLSLAGTRSIGYEFKNNFSLGWRLNAPIFKFEPLAGESYLAESVYGFNRANLPLQDRHGALFAQHNFFEARFGQMTNFNTMGLIEDIQLGPQVVSEVAVAPPAFSMDATFVQPGITLRWNEMWGKDDLSTVEFSTSLRYQLSPSFEGFSAWVNRLHGFLIRQASPIFFNFARILVGARMNLRVEDLSRTVTTVGGNNFLRGFPSGAYQGASTWGTNVEIRSRPWRLTPYLLIGGATFFDMGDAFNGAEELLFRKVHKAAGLGIRVLLPQISALTARFDVAFPIDEIYGPSTTFQFQQAF